ncbi:ATP-binding protein [Macrococcus equipercicus]|uniref:AAA family ATPase n=1 Tax=Macrococcus equipercicus TaxID=69967 RepID=A0A9Q9F117_9STAP|nr:AAA family ATPase [Macrococcus equipercicus]UTH13345.1 AAA family ATPase [Macrococcus equipercicus]
MNIKSLEIYGYGRLRQRKYQLNRSFTQIYGENETGKSTMQLFIHSILFGFPGPDEPKLMPRFATTYGGNLIIEIDGEELFVERVYREHKEELTVMYQDQPKDAAWLNQKLSFITKETYRQIFSFDVLSLQHVHQLTENKLQTYLLQAGVFGSTEYSSLESKLEEEKLKIITHDHESGELYDHLLTLNNLEIQIREEENKLQHYDVHTSRAYQLKGKIDMLRSHIDQLTEIQQRKQKEMMFHADMKEWKQLEHQLNIEPVVFPDNGIERYESLKRQRYNNERDIMLRAEKVKQLTKEAAIELMPDVAYETAQGLLKEEPVIKQHEKTLNNLDRDILDKQAAMHSLQTDIGWSRYEDIPLGDSLKEQIIYNVAEKERLLSQLEQLNREREQAKSEAAMTAQERAELEPHIVSDEQYSNGIQLGAQQDELAQKTELYNKLSAEQKRNAAVDEVKRKKLNIAYGIIALAAVAAAVYFFFSAMLIPALAMIVIPIGMIILFLLNKQPRTYEWNILDDEISALESSIAALAGSLDDSFDLSVQRDYRERLTVLDREQKLHKRKEQQLNNSLEKKQAAYAVIVRELEKTKEQLRLPAHFEDSLLHHVYRTVSRMQQLKTAIDQLKTQYLAQQSVIENFRARLADFGGITNHEHLTVAFQELSAIVKSEEKKRTHKLRRDEQLTISERELAAVKTSADEMNAEIAQLFSDTAAADEAAYYARFAEYKQYKKDLERHQQLSRKLEDENFTYEMNTELAHTSAEDLRRSEAEISDQIHELKDALQQEQFELHRTEQEMAELEKDTTLSGLNYQYAIEREIVNRLAKEYGALNYIETLIASHRQKVKEERIPHIISEASRIFSTLTEGRYIAVMYEVELVVKHKDGQVYHPTELSQSTKELLYIAMRLSLIQHLHHLYPLPIIIDDAFVHFDKQRKDFIIDYLMRKEDNQVLYFTPNRSTNIPGKNTLVLERHDKETK